MKSILVNLAVAMCGLWTGVVRAEGAPEFLLEPTFESCSVYWRSADDRPGVALLWRKRGAVAWNRAPAFPYFPQDGQYRGSVLGLCESEDYEIRILDGKTVCTSGVFRTWSDRVPVVRTVVLGPESFRTPFRIRDKGTADGWIRYTAKPGTVLESDSPTEAVLIQDAEFVVLEGLTIRGGRGRNAIRVRDARNVRIVNCDIAGWGYPEMEVNFNDQAHHYEKRPGGKMIDFHGAINICSRCRNVVVERCFIHDPTLRANSWLYSHPAGPEAITVNSPEGGTVLRWNDFVGSDNHRYNDCVEGGGNFERNGGFNRDADIYGNYMAFANDDNIELDGGMCNVRCFGNRFEQGVCGVSIQGSMVSPVYVTDNLFSGLGEEHGLSFSTIKAASFNCRGNNGSYAYLADNVLWGRGSGVAINPEKTDVEGYRYPRYEIRNNVFCGTDQRLDGMDIPAAAKSVAEGNRMGVAIAEKDLDATYPKRPMHFVLDRARFSGVRIEKGEIAPQQLAFKAIHDGKGPSVPFTVAKGADMDWFAVTPSAGTLSRGECKSFVVTFDPTKMVGRRNWRGVFFVRGADGFSRPLSIFARNVDYVPPFRPDVGESGFALYDDFRAKPIRLKPGMPEKTWTFTVPKTGRYYLLVHAWCDDDPDSKPSGLGATDRRFLMKLDGRERRSVHYLREYPAWSLMGEEVHPFDLEVGEHVLCLTHRRRECWFDGLVITDTPLAFEPR